MKPFLTLSAACAALALAACGSPNAPEPGQPETPGGTTPQPGTPTPGPAPTPPPTEAPGVYSPLVLERCQVTHQDDQGHKDWRCEGRANVPILVRESDGRFDVDAGLTGEAPGIGPFNDPGDVVEWRGPTDAPTAIIYRLVSATPEAPGQSWLVVETVGRDGKAPCVVAVIDGGVADANRVARQKADAVAGFRCGRDEAARITR